MRLWGPGGNIVLSTDGTQLYAANVFLGVVYVVNARTFHIDKVIWLGPGIRYMTLDRQHELLYVANYFNGRVHEVDLHSGVMRVIASVLPRAEWLVKDNRTGHLYVSHVNGVTVLDTSKKLPKGTPQMKKMRFPFYLFNRHDVRLIVFHNRYRFYDLFFLFGLLLKVTNVYFLYLLSRRTVC